MIFIKLFDIIFFVARVLKVLMLVFVVSIGIFVVFKLSWDANNSELGSEPLVFDGSEFACRVDSDCITVDASYCGCSSGGTAVVINRQYVDMWNSKRSTEGEGMMCIAMVSDDWTCSANVKCASGKCTLVDSEKQLR